MLRIPTCAFGHDGCDEVFGRLLSLEKEICAHSTSHIFVTQSITATIYVSRTETMPSNIPSTSIPSGKYPGQGTQPT